ncbi:MAG: pyridoxal-dependent decarboxylase [Gammaproteobacteria bacterium]|nr:pyridoxal-dependent decarboxylase [Gammaproteobacteria bacterium]MDE0247471.1 pyridoxal-dependent decarboxylase [Gammaproteobacteria bacterium]
MASEEFRKWARAAVEWVATYLDGVAEYPVIPGVRPGEIRSRLPGAVPERGECFGRIFDDFERVILPGITHWNHPRFLGYFAVTGSAPGILGELLAAALNVNAMVWKTSPAATELEEHVLDWMRSLLGLPPVFAGVLLDTASSSTMTALMGARQRAHPEVREEGLSRLPPMRVYTSEEAHFSVDRAAILLGLGSGGVVKIPVDRKRRMRPGPLETAVRADAREGRTPLAVVATIGTTSTTSVDPVERIADVAARNGLWLHVDAAYAGPAALLPEKREYFRGWERADSIVVNPHKWLFTPLDCSILLMRSPQEVRAASALTSEYLKTAEGEGTNLMEYGIPLGRRFRALKLWFVLRYFGAAGLRARLREHIRVAEAFAGWVDHAPRWERLAPVPFSTVAFRCAPPGTSASALDRLNLEILERIHRSGEALLSHTRIGGSVALRLAVGNLRTTREDVRRVWGCLRSAAEAAAREASSS